MYGDGRVRGNHQLHCLNLARGLHLTQMPGHIWSELMVFYRALANAMQQVDPAVLRHLRLTIMETSLAAIQV